ncbi:MAG: bifunctional (p)ppGpp synthetase/guanosine-3',5'-bis(diphosphate) 3'-pyrophosphohydrolase [Chloroflexi bacterium]|nr:bifunctional (p)ppGpp synthetase/guanosine-3',5'-bis(diphosphate) 3'-pyrophosphohydrolase [Chloroflexota bacterium]
MVVSGHSPAGTDELFETLDGYLPPERVEAVRGALAFAVEAHEGQLRRSGDPYITHPVAVARLVAELRMDSQTVKAALLHDVIEDCGVTAAQLDERFGADVAKLVEGATKIEHIPQPGRAALAEADAETLRKMLLAMAEDVRVVIIKIADRLHNMQTLEHLPAERRDAIARETMDIYAPLAGRLGIWQIKWQLEDLAFRFLDPESYRRVAAMVASRRQEHERFVRGVVAELRGALEEAGIAADVSGRVKHLRSIDEKMRRYQAEGKSFDQIHDLIALRVLVPKVGDCYNALGVAHQIWRPIPGAFDDYIANPKESLYQSLHTSVIGPGAHPFEVQIRTYEMHEVAEYGVAAHWRYKEEPRSRRDARDEERMEWLRHLLEWQRESSGAEDFLESVKTDVFRDQVFVYTPRGDVRVLPAGSTPIDFAFRIHTDLGLHCVGAKINGRLSTLNTRIANGDVVEIVRGRGTRGPSRDWLNPALGYLGSSNARQKVRQWFRRQERDENVARGREQLERERRRLGLDSVPTDLVRQLGFEAAEEMLEAIGYGGVSPQTLAQKLAEHVAPQVHAPIVSKQPAGTQTPPVRVYGTGGLHVVLARCCGPIPPDPLVGYITRSRGVTVHRRDCTSVVRGEEPERYVECDWEPSGMRYSASIEVHAWDRVGLLRDISTMAATAAVNMVEVRTEEQADRTTTVHIRLETQGGAEFAHLLQQLDAVRGVLSVHRAGG